MRVDHDVEQIDELVRRYDVVTLCLRNVPRTRVPQHITDCHRGKVFTRVDWMKRVADRATVNVVVSELGRMLGDTPLRSIAEVPIPIVEHDTDKFSVITPTVDRVLTTRIIVDQRVTKIYSRDHVDEVIPRLVEMSYIFADWEDVDVVEFFLAFYGFLSIEKAKGKAAATLASTAQPFVELWSDETFLS